MLNRPISPGQALLLLMDSFSHDPIIQIRLKYLYIQGIQSRQDYDFYRNLLPHLLSGYFVLEDAFTINNDPTRRFFETELAFETLKDALMTVPFFLLKQLDYAFFYALPKEAAQEVSATLQGKFLPRGKDIVHQHLSREYSDAIYKLLNAKLYTELGKENHLKAIYLLRINYLIVVLTTLKNDLLPLNIYGSGIFSEENRGKYIFKHPAQGSQHLGLLKSLMPAPKDSCAILTDEDRPYADPKTRAAEKAFFDPEALWPAINFAKLVHPFSNSISGTILMHMRIYQDMNSFKQFPFISFVEFKNFMRCMISLLLHLTGGHSLSEYIAPLSLPVVAKTFSFLGDFTKLNLAALFYEDNQTAFITALDRVQIYNYMILLRENYRENLPDAARNFYINSIRKIFIKEKNSQQPNRVAIFLQKQAILFEKKVSGFSLGEIQQFKKDLITQLTTLKSAPTMAQNKVANKKKIGFTRSRVLLFSYTKPVVGIFKDTLTPNDSNLLKP